MQLEKYCTEEGQTHGNILSLKLRVADLLNKNPLTSTACTELSVPMNFEMLIAERQNETLAAVSVFIFLKKGHMQILKKHLGLNLSLSPSFKGSLYLFSFLEYFEER